MIRMENRSIMETESNKKTGTESDRGVGMKSKVNGK